MNQYSAAYYGYLWAEVLSADMFAVGFERDGQLLSPEAGLRYRRAILSPGGTGSLLAHLTKFLGRAPDQTAFLKARGILG
jgi:Zn-dependent oligopeptidase